jgi:hypothetical protein
VAYLLFHGENKVKLPEEIKVYKPTEECEPKPKKSKKPKKTGDREARGCYLTLCLGFDPRVTSFVVLAFALSSAVACLLAGCESATPGMSVLRFLKQ